MWATSQDQGIYFADTCLGFQFFKNYANICSYNIKLFSFVKGFCCLHKTQIPYFHTQIKLVVSGFSLCIFQLRLKLFSSLYYLYIPATLVILCWSNSHKATQIQGKEKDQTTQ